ncbi:co-chaperonin GroES [Maribacter phage Panino]
MRSPDSFIVTPKYKKYKSGKIIGGVEFETVTSIENAKDVSKEGIVVNIPLNYNGEIEIGDDVIIHHNIFRDYFNQAGKMKHSRAYLYDDLYTAVPEEIFLYKKQGQWKAFGDTCIVKPIEENSDSILEGVSLEHTGTIHISNIHKTDSIIGFTPESEYELWLDDVLYYKMRDIDICIYERFS